jgi:hypothetical protein
VNEDMVIKYSINVHVVARYIFECQKCDEMVIIKKLINILQDTLVIIIIYCSNNNESLDCNCKDINGHYCLLSASFSLFEGRYPPSKTRIGFTL